MEDSVKKGRKGIFKLPLALNSSRSDPSNKQDLLELECALSSFRGDIPHMFWKDRFFIGSVAPMVELFQELKLGFLFTWTSLTNRGQRNKV